MGFVTVRGSGDKRIVGTLRRELGPELKKRFGLSGGFFITVNSPFSFSGVFYRCLIVRRETAKFQTAFQTKPYHDFHIKSKSATIGRAYVRPAYIQ